MPAAITPPSIAGLICDTPSKVVSGRIPSSSDAVTSFSVSAPVFLSTTFILVVIGAISSLNLPSFLACAARLWLCTPKRSCASRGMSYFFATYSAVCSIGQ